MKFNFESKFDSYLQNSTNGNLTKRSTPALSLQGLSYPCGKNRPAKSVVRLRQTSDEDD